MEKVAYFTLMDDERFYRVLNVSVYFFSYVFTSTMVVIVRH